MIRRSRIRRLTPAEKLVRALKRKAKVRMLGSPLVSYRKLQSVADELWSVWVRAYGPDCEVCHVYFHPSAMQCMHGWSRRFKATRFHPDNTFRGCAPCHRRNTPAGPDWYDWMEQRLGSDKFRTTKRLAATRTKLTTSDLHLVILDARTRIAALPSNERKGWALEMEARILAKLQKVAA